MKYIHPDIVVGEPVPQVEPRVNAEALKHALESIRFCRWASLFLFVFVVMFTVFDVSWGVRMGTFGVGFVGLMGWGLRPARKEIRKKQRKYKQDYWSIPLRVNMKSQGYPVLMMVLVQMSFMTSGGASGAASFIGIMALIAGGALVYGARHIREPGQICCVDCEYPLVGLTLPIGCPECGRMIYDGSWTTDRPRVRSGLFLWGGLIAVGIGGLIVYSSFVNPGMFYGPMPRSALKRLALTDSRAFEHLVSTPMSQQETDDLIEKLIALNEGADGWGYEMTMQGLWLDQFSGRLRFRRSS